MLDLGCGDGKLLKALQERFHIEGYGLEIDARQITACIRNGVNVIEKDIDNGLANFADNSFDMVIMTQALQVMHNPHLVLNEMLRVGRECIVTFPNFGHWRARCHLMFNGGMPVTRQLRYQWYDTPNIHFCTVRDFETLCKQQRIRTLDHQVVSERKSDELLKPLWPNLFGDTAIYHLSR